MMARYALFRGPGEPLEMCSHAVDQVAVEETIVRVSLCTLCGSDLHSFRGDRQVACPTVLGHEMVGTVSRLPSGQLLKDVRGDNLKLGDRVVWSVAVHCGECYSCQSGLPQKCESLFKYGHQRHDPERPLVGGVADHCQLLAGTSLVKVPDHVADEVAAPASCATATVVAACRRLELQQTQSLLIMGAGMLGLTAAALASSLGVDEVIVADVNDARLELARQFGATVVVNAGDDPSMLSSEVARASAGRGVDGVLELSGSSVACENGIRALRTGGRMVLVGAVFPVDAVAIDPEDMVRRCLRIEGVHNYAPEDLQEAVEFLAGDGTRFPFADLVGQRFSLDQAEAAFLAAGSSDSCRTGVVMEREAD